MMGVVLRNPDKKVNLYGGHNHSNRVRGERLRNTVVPNMFYLVLSLLKCSVACDFATNLFYFSRPIVTISRIIQSCLYQVYRGASRMKTG